MSPSHLPTKAPPAGFHIFLLRRIAAFILVAILYELPNNPSNQAHSADKTRVPNIVIILADDKY